MGFLHVIALTILGLGLFLGTAVLNHWMGVGPIIPVIVLIPLVYSFVNTEWVFLKLTTRNLRLYFGIIEGITVLGAIAGLIALADQRETAAAERIIALGKTDQPRQAQLLAGADDKMMEKIRLIAPQLAAAEIRRRADAIVEANSQIERSNQTEIDQILAAERRLSDDDVDQKVEIYTKLVSLAPGRTDFQDKLAIWNREKIYRENVKKDPMQGMKLLSYSWYKRQSNNDLIVDIKVKNITPFPLKDFSLRCMQEAQSGTLLQSPTDFDSPSYYYTPGHVAYAHYPNTSAAYITIYQRVEPGETREITHFDMEKLNPQTETVECQTGSATVVRGM